MKTSAYKKYILLLVLSSLLSMAACTTGEVSTYRPTSYPVYKNQYYYPDLRPQEDDPLFWLMWQDSQGGG